MRRLLEAPGQWRNDLQRSAPKCIAHRGRAGATRCNRICLPINTAICCSALPRLQGVAGASPRYRPAAGRLLDWQGNCARADGASLSDANARPPSSGCRVETPL